MNDEKRAIQKAFAARFNILFVSVREREMGDFGRCAKDTRVLDWVAWLPTFL